MPDDYGRKVLNVHEAREQAVERRSAEAARTSGRREKENRKEEGRAGTRKYREEGNRMDAEEGIDDATMVKIEMMLMMTRRTRWWWRRRK
eukprot:768641-Hanusia_phi.AAC.2